MLGMSMSRLWCASVIAAAVLPAGCTTGSASASVAPSVLRYAYSPGTEEPEAQTLRLERLREHLANSLGMEVQLFKTSGSYGAVIEAMRAKKIDVATLGPFSYLIAAEKAGADVIVVRGTMDGEHASYGGTIAVAGHSPIRTIDELIARAGELTFSFVDPASTSGFLVQQHYLQSRGLDPEKSFKKVLFSSNHLASAMTLIAGKVDAAAIMEPVPGNTIYKRLYSSGRIREGEIRILWRSPRIPSSPIAVRRDLPERLKREIQRALVEIPQRDPELWAMWPKSGAPTDQIVLMPATDAMFDGLRDMARGIENLSLLD
jgi:phosphonate transport system substrate-binding protein